MLETILSLDYEAIIAAITTLAAAFAGILAGIKNKEAKKQEQTANAYAELAEQTEREKQEVIDFFDPENAEVQTPPTSIPERSWKMSEAVKGKSKSSSRWKRQRQRNSASTPSAMNTAITKSSTVRLTDTPFGASNLG